MLFGSEEALRRFDMTEYSEAHSVSRLLGPPPGYVGYDEGGQLTESVRRKPYCVVLFDELEKAHSDIWSVLLPLMEDGILTDSKGRTVDFRSTVIVMTSNASAEMLSSRRVPLGFSQDMPESMRQLSVLEELQKTFRPEFLNRLDEIIVFSPLGNAELEAIAKKLLEEIAGRLQALGYCFSYTAECVSFLAQRGFDARYGARPLRRLVQGKVETPAASMLLSGELSPGDCLSLAVSQGEITLTACCPISS